MKKRLLYILHCYYNVAGTEEHTRLLASSLQNDLEIWIAAPHNGRVVLLQNGVEVESYPVKPIPWPIAPFRSDTHEDALQKIIDKVKPSVIHVQHFIHWHLGLLHQLRSTGLPVFITFHDYFAITPQFTMLGIVDPRVTLGPNYSQYHFGGDITQYLKERRAIFSEALQPLIKIVPSNFLANTMEAIFPGNYKVIPHGIVPFAAKPVTPCSHIRFGYVGSLLVQKGYHSLIEGFSKLRNDHPEVTLEIFGDGDQADKNPRAGVVFHGKYQTSDLPTIMSSFDIGVIPSIFAETFCLVLSELWSAQKPVAASAIGALTERISEGDNGKFFKTGDADSIHQTLKWFVKNDEWKNWKMPQVRVVDEMIADYRRLYDEAR